MSDLSAPLANATAAANGAIPSMRANAGSNAASTTGDTPSFSSVLKDKANAANAEPKPAEKAERVRERDESAAARPAERSEKEAAPAKTGKAEKEEQRQDETGGDVTVAEDAEAITPIAAVMIQLTPAALVSAAAQGETHDAVTHGAMVREMARGHGRNDKAEAANQGLALAVGHSDGEAVPVAAAGDAATPSFDQHTNAHMGAGALSAEGQASENLGTENLPVANGLVATLAADEEGELSALGSLADSGTQEADFTQVLARARDGHGMSASGEVQHTRSDPAVTMRAPVGHPNWSNELGDKMTWMVTQQKQQADLVLNPPQLGRIEVSLTVSGDQASAVFTSPNAAVREMLENSLPRLREILAGSGLNLGQADVGAQSFAQQQQAQNSQRGDALAHRDSLLPEIPAQSAGTLSLGRAGQGSGVVDIFA